MSYQADIYKDTVKHLRVVRNITRAHKNALNITTIEPDSMTPYERGRMTRSCIRLGNNIEPLLYDQSQLKIAVAFCMYMDGIGVNGSQFSKAGISAWANIWNKCEDFIVNSDTKNLDFQTMITHVADMIDSPLSETPGRIMLLKLSV
jgi:hypothetical protein